MSFCFNHLLPRLVSNIFFNAYINRPLQCIFTKYTYFYSPFCIWHAFPQSVYANIDKKEPLPIFKHHQTCVKPTKSAYRLTSVKVKPAIMFHGLFCQLNFKFSLPEKYNILFFIFRPTNNFIHLILNSTLYSAVKMIDAF